MFIGLEAAVREILDLVDPREGHVGKKKKRKKGG